jgi:hypothetical protein
VQRAFFRQLFEARIERSRESARAWLAWAEENEPELYERAAGRKARRPPQ